MSDIEQRLRENYSVYLINPEPGDERNLLNEDYSYYEGYLPLWQEWAKQNPELIEELREKSKGKVLTDQFANTRVSQARALADILNLTKQTNYDRERNRGKDSVVQEGTSVHRNESEGNRGGDKFSGNPAGTQDRGGLLQRVVRDGNYVTQRLQSYSQKVTVRESELSDSEYKDFNSRNPLQRAVFLADRKITERLREKGVTATAQRIRLANASDFHKAISQVKTGNPNGWMVDVHEQSDYENYTCFLTEDGKSGIAVTPEGDIVSVFSTVSGDYRLEKLMQIAIAAGGYKLDCYYLNVHGTLKGLPGLYSRFGFKVASVTPFNEEYVADNPDYQNWKNSHSDTKVEGVAAMYLENATNEAVDNIDTYSKDRLSGIESISTNQRFEGENGYDNMLSYRDNIVRSILNPADAVQQPIQEAQRTTLAIDVNELQLKASAVLGSPQVTLVMRT